MKACQKLFALARVSNYMDTEKVRLIMKSFIMSHFSCCPLIGMFHDRAAKTQINKIPKELCELYSETLKPPFLRTFSKRLFSSVHQRNLHLLMIEIYRNKNSLNISFFGDIFVERTNISYNLGNNDILLVLRANT